MSCLPFSTRSKLLVQLAQQQCKTGPGQPEKNYQQAKKETSRNVDLEANDNQTMPTTEVGEKGSTADQCLDGMFMVVQLASDDGGTPSATTDEENVVTVTEDNDLNGGEIQDISNELMLVDSIILEEKCMMSDSALFEELGLTSSTIIDGCMNNSDEIGGETTTISEIINEVSVNDENDCNAVNTGDTNMERVGVNERKKRRKFEIPLSQRKKEKEKKMKEKHNVKPPCSHLCKRKCSEHIDENQRKLINEQFWAGTFIQRKSFILNTCERLQVQRRTINNDPLAFRKKNTFKYFFKDINDKKHEVCKVFFLTTLGFHKKNDKVIHSVLSKTPKGNISPKGDGRGKHPAVNIGPHLEIAEHVESFHPTISHYRREHAPNTRYLPSDVCINFMHKDFITKNPQFKNTVSYELYRKTLKKMKISFSRLGHEECERCEEFLLHGHDENNLNGDCDLCKNYLEHKDKVTKSRELYQKYSKPEEEEFKLIANDPNTIVVSADLQKIIMIPRIDMFKTVLFTPRLIVYHETFAPVGKTTKLNPNAILWHEAITGRNKEDIVSAFYSFLKKHRDIQRFIIWLDNCSAQNKNWCIFSFIVYAVNCTELNANEIQFMYFEPGHSYMSADSFHHQVEQSLKKQKKTYDFDDFVDAVANANSKNVDVLKMQVSDFFTYPDCSSQQKLKVTTGRPYLKDIVEVKATRGEYFLKCKTDYADEDYKHLDFLKKKCMSKMPDPVQHEAPAGFSRSKRDNLLKNLGSVIPENRKDFWLKLPVV